MDYSKPTLLVISGPNGAGKSTHIESMLPDSFNGIALFDRDLTRANIAHCKKRAYLLSRFQHVPHK